MRLPVLLLHNLLDVLNVLLCSFPEARVYMGVCNDTCACSAGSYVIFSKPEHLTVSLSEDIGDGDECTNFRGSDGDGNQQR